MCQQGCCSPLLETQSRGISSLWTPPAFSRSDYPHDENHRFLLWTLLLKNAAWQHNLSAYPMQKKLCSLVLRRAGNEKGDCKGNDLQYSFLRMHCCEYQRANHSATFPDALSASRMRWTVLPQPSIRQAL